MNYLRYCGNAPKTMPALFLFGVNEHLEREQKQGKQGLIISFHDDG